MRDIKIWKKELFSEICTIADLEELENLWSGKNKTAISSFSEEVSHVFDDYDIDGLIAKGANEIGLTSDQFNALCRFRDQFLSYINSAPQGNSAHPNYLDVLKDPKWIAVSKAAQEFSVLLDQ
jgi:hypothetical protein